MFSINTNCVSAFDVRTTETAGQQSAPCRDYLTKTIHLNAPVRDANTLLPIAVISSIKEFCLFCFLTTGRKIIRIREG